MPAIHFITHPEVAIDPAVPVTDWALSPAGLRRMRAAASQPWLDAVRSVFCSTERKALQAAAILAERLGVEPVAIAALGENDRAATGYLPRAEFEAVADRFFANPHHSVRGWERAADAQRRIVTAVGSAAAQTPPGDVAIVAHGAVGALLLCHLHAVPITRTLDQPGDGGGNLFTFDRDTWQPAGRWRPIDR